MSEVIPLRGVARQLVTAGLLEEGKARQALMNASREKLPFVSYVVQQRWVSAVSMMELLADQFGIAYFDLSQFNLQLLDKTLVNERLVREHRLLPLYRRGNRLYVAVSDPSRAQAVNDVQFSTALNVEMLLVEDNKLQEAIERLYDAPLSGMEGLDAELDGLETTTGDAPAQDSDGDAADDAPIVRFVNKLLLDAIKGSSSDLHFEPYEQMYRVRFRTDGVLHEAARPPANLAPRIAARLKVMAGLDISERRKPQDGRIKMRVSKTRSIDFRVNTLPTLWGEKVVMRILDPSSAKMGIDALGYEEAQKKLYLDALGKPQGMILVTGPTGSGKTVSLYTGLNILNTPDVNISTAEDPVEINLEGINQVNVNPRQGMDFSQALRAFLRQDPDVIMVGEIRDLETAEIAIKAAQTGHMVMSTLHTNSAAETLTRLRNMGVAAFNIATSVNLIIAQRLARRLCSHCKTLQAVPKDALLDEGFLPAQVDTIKVYGPVGCEECKNGYRGRVGIYEVVRITPALQRLIMEDGNSIEISEQMRKDGFADLRTSALMKVQQGLTSLAEVNRVTKD